MFLIYSQVKYENEKWSFRMKTDFDFPDFINVFINIWQCAYGIF